MKYTMKLECCRTCLSHKQSLKPLYPGEEHNINYAYMLGQISDIMVAPDDGLSELICLSCRRKIQDCYNFKCMIEKSDKFLRRHSVLTKPRKILFNNFTDLKVEFEIVKNHNDCRDEKYITFPLPNSQNCVYYKDTIIKKVNFNKDTIKLEAEQITLDEFLSNIKNEIISDSGGDSDKEKYDHKQISSDDEYMPPLHFKLRDKNHKNTNKKRNIKGKCKHIEKKSMHPNKIKKKNLTIKPIILENYRLIPAKTTKIRVKKPKRKPKKRSEVCPVCGKISANLNVHMRVHTAASKYKCSQCPKAYSSKKNLSDHQLAHGERSFKCSKCPAAFYQALALKRHGDTHTKDHKPFICDVCSKGFSQRYHMKRHYLIHSSANKTVKCELCNMSFFDKYQLKHHMRIHTGERPFRCEICSQPYSYKHDFNRHCFKKHGVYLKRRQVYVMNEAVLQKELALMQEVLVKAQLSNQLEQVSAPPAYTDPHVAKAYQQTITALQSKQW